MVRPVYSIEESSSSPSMEGVGDMRDGVEMRDRDLWIGSLDEPVWVLLRETWEYTSRGG